jgi:homoserine O-acetyltransferase
MSTGSKAPLPDPFRLHRGGELPGGVIAYEAWGELNAARDNAVLLFTGLSPSAHAASSIQDSRPGWWELLIAAGGALDTNRYFIICVNSLGSCFGSTGPASIDPRTGCRYGKHFPELTVEDVARGGHAVLEHLGLRQVHAVLGPSLGGMTVLAFIALFPQAAKHLLSISGTAAASPYAIALRSLQREAVTLDAAWRDGDYLPESPPRAGLALARKIGTITYRSARELQQRFARTPSAAGHDFAVQDYLAQQARKFVEAFDANCYLRLSRAMDLFDLTQHGDPAMLFRRSSLQSALVIGVELDQLFSIEEQARIADALQAGGVTTTFARLDSLAGHDAFLVDFTSFAATIRRWFDSHSPVAVDHAP